MDKDLASDLIDSKLRSIKKQISEILDKWQQSSVGSSKWRFRSLQIRVTFYFRYIFGIGANIINGTIFTIFL